MRAPGLASVSIDLDALSCYCRIYGLPVPPGDDPVYTRGLPRLLDLLTELGLPATLFVVGQDLLHQPARAALLRDAAGAGFEIANHSHSHPYDLVRLPPDEQAAQLLQAHEAIAAAVGSPPVGFRAPGYTVSRPLLGRLRATGYRYDSSMLPSAPYYLTKLAALGLLKLRGRRSASIVGDPRVLRTPRQPFVPGGCGYRPAHQAERPVGPLELPISVLPPLGLPLVGQTLFLAGSELCGLLLRLDPGPHLNLELHAIDGCGLERDGLPVQLGAQPDLRVSLTSKLRILREVLLLLRSRFQVVTLARAAQLLEPSSSQ